MKTYVRFTSSSRHAVDLSGTFQNPTAEQLERYNTLQISYHLDPEIQVPAALIVLLGTTANYIKVKVPGSALNGYCDIFDDGDKPDAALRDGEVIQAWLSAGAPVEWDGKSCQNPAPRAKLTRDAAGRYKKATT